MDRRRALSALAALPTLAAAQGKVRRVGFISGAMMSDAERAGGRPICLSGVSANRLRRAFTGFAKKHRDLMSRHADSLVATAAAQSFRCKHTEARH